MRKGTILLLLAAMAFAGLTCLSALGYAAPQANTLEPTDSGAPSAIVMFPLDQKPNHEAAAMAPVAFNHLVHEKWMSRAGKDCIVCHHTGDPVACAICHTVQGTAEGGNVTLYQAMHAPRVAQRKADTPSSCVSCHNRQTENRNCAGCHKSLVKDKDVQNEAWCAVCHAITPKMTKRQLEEGIAGKLPENQNEALATETALARRQAEYWSPMAGPYKVVINELQGKYEPCVFNHRHHVASLIERIRNNKLAGAFHTDPGTVCVTCHHHSPASLNPPKCVSCHSKKINPADPGRPALLAAYHLQCMNCHADMKVARPAKTDCTTCHKLRPEAGEGGK